MRIKTAIYNNITSTALQLTTLIFGLIIPRLMIQNYGSELNGLVTSTKQIISYLQYLELGMTAALVYTLYKPMALQDYEKINPIVSRAKREYEKISIGYFVGVLSLSLIYPFILKENLGYTSVFIIVFLIGIYGILEFLTISKYRVLLDSDLKTYIINLIATLTIVLQYLTSILLLLLNQSIFLVVFIPSAFLPIRSLLLKIYIRKKYKNIDYNTEPVKIKLESRKDAFISGLSSSINVSVPIIIISLIISLETASVFSIYSMVYMGLAGIINVLNSGMRTVFGNVYAKGEKETLINSNDYFEFLLYFLLSVLYAAALVLIIPFIKVYVTDVADINYVYPSIGVLFTIWSVLHTSIIPNQTMVDATGNWKMLTQSNILQIALLLCGTIFLGLFFSVNGVLIGMIIATLYKSLTIMHLSNKNILTISSKKSLGRLLRVFFVIFLVNLPIILLNIKIDVNNFLEWIIVAIIVSIWALVITSLVNIIFDYNVLKSIFMKYLKPKFSKK